MAKQRFELNKDEKIVYKVSGVMHGFWGVYTNVLYVTNQEVILEEYGLINNFKGVKRYNYDDVKQAIIGQALNGREQLELLVGDAVETFSVQSNNEIELSVIVQAINDQMGPDADYYDLNYYRNMLIKLRDTDKIMQVQDFAKNINDVFIAGNFKKAAKSLKSGNIKGAAKAFVNPTKGIIGGVMDEVLDDIGVHDIQDMFTEMGNDIREDFGLKPKMTHADRREKKELEEKLNNNRKKQVKKETFNKIVTESKDRIEQMKEKDNKKIDSVNEKFEALKKGKELLDAGVLTQEEFDKIKKDLLNKL